MRRKAPIEIKGTVNGLYIVIDKTLSFQEVITQLEIMLSKSVGFYKGSSIIGCNGKTLSYKEKYELETLFETTYDLKVDSLEPLAEVKKTTPYKPTLPQIIEREVVVEKEIIKSDTHFVYGTMRSGKRVEYSGNVIVLGDVNAGAEVIATGNVVIVGKLLGFVHAGASGNDEAYVVANAFLPTQVRISKYISVPPKDEVKLHALAPEKAFISDGVIRIEKIH